MFLLRIKTEITENLKLVLGLWLALGVILWSFLDWWLAPLTAERDQGVVGGFAVLALGAIVFFLVSTMFKRDDLKHPQDFWATRPIRAFTFFGTKLVFVLLVVVMPMGLLMMLLGFVAGIGGQAIWHGLETMLWAGAVTSLLALSCMAFPGGGRALLCALAFFGGVILTSIILGNLESIPWRSYAVGETRIASNLLVVLCLLTAIFTWQGLRQIRDKHRRQSVPVFAATGILTVLVVTFVPLPGGLSNTVISTKATTLPTVTKAKASESNMAFGLRDGVGFVSMNIELNPDDPILGDAVEIPGTNLRITGSGDVPQEVELAYTMRSALRGPDGMIEARPTLVYSVFERQPGSRSSTSSSGDANQTRIVSSLPRKKIGISGTLEIKRIVYRTVHRGSLNRPFQIKQSGLRVAYTNSPDRFVNYENSVCWKAYRPPLLSSLSTDRWDLVRFRLDHPASHAIDWYERLEGSGSGGGAFFGPFRHNELRVSDREIESNYYWDRLKESGYNKSVSEWKAEAELVCEVVDHVSPLILPVDVEVEVPDPEKVRELLLKGGL